MASTVLSRDVSHGRKVSKAEATRRIVSMLERYMDAQNFSEQEKDRRIARLAERVEVVIERRAKR